MQHNAAAGRVGSYRGAPLSYEEVVAAHRGAYPAKPQDFEEMRGLGMEFTESVVRFMRTAHFFTPASCWKTLSMYSHCCGAHPGVVGQAESDLSCFHILDTKALCCGKQRLWDHLFVRRGHFFFNSSKSHWLQGREEELDVVPGCSALHALLEADVASWMRAWLELPKAQQGPCVAGTLAQRLQRSDVEVSRAAVEALLHSLEKACLPRRALVALRRNLMLWRHREREGWGPRRLELDSLLGRALQALERCRLALPASPVLHLHVPKTAGISLCTWANRSGFDARKFHNARCHLRGDGPFWLGEAAIPMTCGQRLRKLAQANSSWMSVERWVDLPLCDDLQYVVALREPVERTLHHFRHLLVFFLSDFWQVSLDIDLPSLLRSFYAKLWRLVHSPPGLWQYGDSDVAVDEKVGSIAGLADWIALWQGIASNYQVRSLAGASGGRAFLEDVLAAPRRLGAAKATLEQLDAVLVLDEGQLLRQRQAQFLLEILGGARRGALAPEIPSYSHQHNQEGTPLPPSVVDYHWTVGERRMLRVLNAADTSLVSHASLLQQLDQEYLDLVTASEHTL